MDAPVLIYTTFPDSEVGLEIGEALVREGLATCVNILPGMRSVYSWNGSVERGAEVVGIIKTRSGLRDEAAAALKWRHPYETPIVVFLLTAGADPDTLAWLLGGTPGPPRGA